MRLIFNDCAENFLALAALNDIDGGLGQKGNWRDCCLFAIIALGMTALRASWQCISVVNQFIIYPHFSGIVENAHAALIPQEVAA